MKLGAHQFEKLDNRGREHLLGTIKETLEKPNIILKEIREEKESFLYVKSFRDGEKLAQGCWEEACRTNVQTAYNAGRLMQYQDNPPPAWELLFIEDGRTSQICKGLARVAGHGAIPADHNFWKTYGFPPYHFNCRTTFRAVYGDESYYDTPRINPTMKSIRKAFKPQSGFGGNPLDKESFWRLTPGMLKRMERYGLKNDVENFAKKLGIKNYDVRLANEVVNRELGHTGFHVKIIKGANPKQHEIEIAKILHKNGHEVLFTPENNFIQGTKNPEGILTDKNAVIEMKEITSKKLDKVFDNIEKAVEQNAEIVILNLVGEKDFAEEDAINVAKEQLYNSKKTLREIWLIYGEKISRIKR